MLKILKTFEDNEFPTTRNWYHYVLSFDIVIKPITLNKKSGKS